ncbi:hypothetical protein EVG20_g679 [Dentipellis fragilis]|uniref:Uncharacterized protein n=1 Tax=Dentipellis fragilis TaxID=205917 RepID=A0A4Y9ZCP4_9AGAM|nr:hypothetical protein EVG20_g679 [Dentipellis fragilis]
MRSGGLVGFRRVSAEVAGLRQVERTWTEGNEDEYSVLSAEHIKVLGEAAEWVCHWLECRTGTEIEAEGNLRSQIFFLSPDMQAPSPIAEDHYSPSAGSFLLRFSIISHMNLTSRYSDDS